MVGTCKEVETNLELEPSSYMRLGGPLASGYSRYHASAVTVFERVVELSVSTAITRIFFRTIDQMSDQGS